MHFPKVSDITDKNILYKFVMKIQTPDISRSDSVLTCFSISIHILVVMPRYQYFLDNSYFH